MKKGYQVKTDATERVNQIVELYLSKANKDQHISQAAGEGKTVAQMLVDYEGDLPGGSGYFHELVIAVVDRLRCIYITADEREAESIINQLIEEDQHYILATGFYKRRVNEFNQRYTQELIATEIFNISDNTYKYTLERIRLEIIDIDQRTRTVKRAA
jgi:hypothetical protein